MNRLNNIALTVLWLAIAVCVALGCSSTTNPWKQNWVGPKDVGAPTKDVEVRVVSMSQMRAIEAAARTFFDSRKLAPEDINSQDARYLRQVLLTEFRMRDDVDTIARYGVSQFRTTSSAQPNDPQLLSFAKSIGSDVVVVATEFIGQSDGYMTIPQFSSTTGNAFATARNSYGGWGSANVTANTMTTTSVVVPTKYSWYETIAFYFRRISREERARLDAQQDAGLRKRVP